MKIISITKTSHPYHPAVGFTYQLKLDDGNEIRVTDDELLENFQFLRTGEYNEKLVLSKMPGCEWPEKHEPPTLVEIYTKPPII